MSHGLGFRVGLKDPPLFQVCWLLKRIVESLGTHLGAGLHNGRSSDRMAIAQVTVQQLRTHEALGFKCFGV